MFSSISFSQIIMLTIALLIIATSLVGCVARCYLFLLLAFNLHWPLTADRWLPAFCAAPRAGVGEAEYTVIPPSPLFSRQSVSPSEVYRPYFEGVAGSSALQPAQNSAVAAAPPGARTRSCGASDKHSTASGKVPCPCHLPSRSLLASVGALEMSIFPRWSSSIRLLALSHHSPSVSLSLSIHVICCLCLLALFGSRLAVLVRRLRTIATDCGAHCVRPEAWPSLRIRGTRARQY